MILVTCTVSSITTERAASNTIVRLQQEDKSNMEQAPTEERILIPIANPATIEHLVNMALLMKNPKRGVASLRSLRQ